MRDETLALLEDCAVEALHRMSDEADDKMRQLYRHEACDLVDKIVSVEQRADEYWDKKEKRNLEQKRAEEANEIEREKLKLPMKRIVFEISKVVIPTALSLAAYGYYQTKVMKYEETGRITSTAGRQLSLPKPFKF